MTGELTAPDLPTSAPDRAWPEDIRGHLRVIGDWSFTVDAHTFTAADFGGARQATCFARLCSAAGTPVGREELADAVWGPERPSSWSSSLRNMIARARKVVAEVPDATLENTLGGQLFQLRGGVVDDVTLLVTAADQLRAHVAQGRSGDVLQQATDLLQQTAGPVAPGLVGPWVEHVRTTIATTRLRIAAIGAEAALRLNEPGRAVDLSRLMIELQPGQESGYQLLMRSLHAVGDRAAALEAYEMLRRRLRNELGSTPSQQTQDIFLDILRNPESTTVRDLRRRVPYSTGRLRVFHAAVPLVGRAQELGDLTRLLLDGKDPTPLVLLTGAPGMGKTRVSAALAAAADARDFLVLHGRADSRFPTPYAALAEAIDGYLGVLRRAEVADLAGNHAAELARFLPSCRMVADPTPPTGSSRLARLHAERALVHLLTRIGESGPVLVVLDDLQWSALSVSRFLQLLAEGPGIPGVAFLAVYRDLTEHPIQAASQSPGRVAEVAIEPLDRADVIELTRQAAPGLGISAQLAPDLGEALWTISGGHPLTVTTLLRGRADEMARLSRPERWGALVSELMPVLPAETAAVITAVAVAREPVSVELVLSITDLDLDTVTQVMRSAALLGLVIPDVQVRGQVQILHPAIADAIAGSLSPAAHHELRARVELARVEAGARSPVSQEPAENHDPAPTSWNDLLAVVLPAMRSAIDRGDYITAVERGLVLYQALERSGDPDIETRWRTEILLGEAWRALGDERAHATLHGVIAEARTAGAPRVMAEAALVFTSAGTGTDEPFLSDSLMALYEEVLDELPAQERALRAELLAHLGTAYGWRNSAEAAATATTQAITLAEELGDPRTLVTVYATGRQAMAGSGLVDVQEMYEDRLRQLIDTYDDAPTRVRIALWSFESRVQRGRGEGLESLLEDIERDFVHVRDIGTRHSVAYAKAALHLIRGRLDDAEKAIGDSALIGKSIAGSASIVEAIRLIQLTALRLEQGRLAEIRNELVAFCSSADIPEWWGTMAYVDSELDRREDIPRILELFFTGFDRAGARIAIPHGLAGFMAAPIRLIGDLERARTLYDFLLPSAGLGGYIGCFAGPTDLALGILADALGETTTARAHFEAGAAFADRLGAPLWRERCLRELDRLNH